MHEGRARDGRPMSDVGVWELLRDPRDPQLSVAIEEGSGDSAKL